MGSTSRSFMLMRKGSWPLLGVHDARNPDSVVQGTWLRTDYAHAVDLFVIHGDILTRTTDDFPTSTPTGQPRNGNLLRDVAWPDEDVVRTSVWHSPAGRVVANIAPEGTFLQRLCCVQEGFLNLINNGRLVIPNK